MKIIYGVCAWGLGHATRSLPIIRKLIAENHDVLIISSGRALELVKSELNDSATYEDIPDYPAPGQTDPVAVLSEGFLYIPRYINAMRKEIAALEKKILNKKRYDIIIADNRYGIYQRDRPAYFITHQLRIMNPFRIRFLETGTEIYNMFFMRRRYAILVPDFKDDSLSGDLSHNLRYIDESKIDYIGPLSDFHKNNANKDIDAFFSISGPEPHRGNLENKIIDQLESVSNNRNVVLTLGKTEEHIEKKIKGVTVLSSLSSKDRETMLNRSKLVVSRSGYSTLMDIATVGTKALFIPTPNQPEQEYLAKYHDEKGTFCSVSQNDIDLEQDIKKAMSYKGLDRDMNTGKSVENAMRVIFSGKKIDW